jgi:hypothetical protein
LPLPILLLRKRKLRHSLGKPSRSDFVQLEIICQTFGITLAEFFNDTDVLVSMTEEEKKYVVTVESADSCSENGCDKYYRSATVL